MSWADATINFLKCLGPIPPLKLDELYNNDNYPVTETGFNGLMRHFIRSLCLDKNAKGTLKQSIKSGNWIKPEDTEIQEHHQKVIHLFKWINQVPGFHCGEMMKMEKYRLYVTTFPTHWAKRLHSLRRFTEATTYDSIDEFMQEQKDNVDRNKKKKKKDE